MAFDFEPAISAVEALSDRRRGLGRLCVPKTLNHAPDIAAMDLLVIPTIGLKLLYGFVIVRIDRDLVWINVTTNPTAEWIARQTVLRVT
jgi:hypothetical protein